MNTFGERLRLSTFGESHGAAIGGVLDGFPAGVAIEPSNIQSELDRRKPGGKYATPRKEADEIEILSGIFDGRSTGAPIGFIIRNANQHSKDYENLKDISAPHTPIFRILPNTGCAITEAADGQALAKPPYAWLRERLRKSC